LHARAVWTNSNNLLVESDDFRVFLLDVILHMIGKDLRSASGE
jgi:hypothetical protein